MFCCKSHSNLIWDNKNQNNFECYCSTTFRHMINNRVVKSCFLRCFQSPSSERQVLALPMPRRGKGAWLGGCQEFSIEQHLLFLTIFLQLCSGQLDSPPHLKRNHPARETSTSPTKKFQILKELANVRISFGFKCRSDGISYSFGSSLYKQFN